MLALTQIDHATLHLILDDLSHDDEPLIVVVMTCHTEFRLQAAILHGKRVYRKGPIDASAEGALRGLLMSMANETTYILANEGENVN